MDLIAPKTGKPAHRCDAVTREWFRMHPGIDTTLAQCEKCGLWYKTGREQLHQCEDLIDPATGVLLHPGVPDRCPGNGTEPDYEICCDNCNWFLECFPEYDKKGVNNV